jgi:renalase
MKSMTGAPTIAIIGAGIAGASAARALHDRGVLVRVYDKGRAPGGRAATRTRDGAHFDHGAQYFTARDPVFVAQTQAWVESGLVREWCPRLLAIDALGRRSDAVAQVRWVGVPGMNQLAINLLKGVELACSQRVLSVERQADGWWLQMASGPEQGPFAVVLSTLPAPQAVQLLANESVIAPAAGLSFAPCWALMLEFADALDPGFDAAFVNAGDLSWIARDSSKPGRPDAERWLVHAGPEFSRRALAEPAESVAAHLLREFFAATQVAAIQPRWVRAHRWSYALAQPPLSAGALYDNQRQIAVGGDWCHGSRVEGAYLSGLKLAEWACTLV